MSVNRLFHDLITDILLLRGGGGGGVRLADKES